MKSPDYTMPPVAQDAWWRPTVPTGLTEPRWVRAIEIRPVGKNARKITHHALARLAAAGRHGSGALHQRSERLRRRPLHGMGGRQERRRDASRLGPPDAARTRRSPGRCTITRSARRSPRTPSSRVWFYPKGQEPKHREVLGAVQHLLRLGARRPRARHPAEPGDDDRELRDAEAERAHRELPGAHAPARQGHVDGSDLSRTAAARC